MISDTIIETNKMVIIKLLELTNRKGMDNLILFLAHSDFFEAPASTKHHGSYKGGLAQHSINVFRQFMKLNQVYEQKIPDETITITALLHDMCKIGLYKKVEGKYKYNKDVGDEGHGSLSLSRVLKFVELTDVERNLILYHMGVYGTNESSSWQKRDYTLKKYLEMSNTCPEIKLIHFADEFASIIERKGENDEAEIQ